MDYQFLPSTFSTYKSTHVYMYLLQNGTNRTYTAMYVPIVPVPDQYITHVHLLVYVACSTNDFWYKLYLQRFSPISHMF